jgi:phosphohistidine phosphatase
MDLYIIRHADALPLGVNGITADEERPLSKTGEAQARQLAAALSRRGIRLEKVVSSPLVRARQTAEGLVQALSAPQPEVILGDELAPGGKRRNLIKFLRAVGGAAVAVVGHQPDLGDLAAWLIGGKKARIDLAKAGVAQITFSNGPDKGAGTLVGLMAPEWFGEDSSAPTAAS